MIDAGSRRVPGPVRRGALAGGVVVTALVLAGCASSAAGNPAAAPAESGSAQSTPPPGSHPSPRAITERTVTRLLAELSAPSGASERSTAPAKPLRNPSGLPDRYRVSRTHWWVAPGTVAANLAYFRAHPVDGTHLDGTGSVAGPGSGNVRTLDFGADGPTWVRSKIYTQLELGVDVMKIGDHVGIRADADAIVLPQRTKAEQIPTTVRSVHVVAHRGRSGRKTVGTLGATEARRLAELVNGLPVENPEPIPCPAAFPGYDDTLTFRGAGAPIRVRAQSDGCGAVTVFRPHALHPVLSDGAAVDHAVRAALRGN
jgi:hypothetical protein